MLNKYKKYIVPALIIFQFLWIIATVFILEVNLATGKTIKLQLAPVDPRSLMQGDYVILNYTISRIPHYTPSPSESRVRVILSPDNKGIYNVKSIFSPSAFLEQDDVVVNGTFMGDRIFYGIENYFVPEGTGKQVERSVRFALVKVSAWGDAMLIKLLEE
ncbi:MAG: GDYXXLXY domain-containing protein [Spirochaetales bacterium]|nr:GDYXXLXY domain-containing protein [Spirochaetales bacterium]